MKFLSLFLFLIALGTSTGEAGSATDRWSTDLPRAQAEARASGKFVFIHFSGSDWCGWCMKLRKEVFGKPQFDDYARSNLVLVRVDFPKRAIQPTAVQKTNQRLAERFEVLGYPTLVLLNSQGEKLDLVSYGHGGARQMVADIDKVIRPPLDYPPQKSPMRKGSELHRADKISRGGSPSPTSLTLKKITGTKQRRQAVINNQTLSRGESAVVRVANGQVRVRCVEIRDRSVVVVVEGEREQRELVLPAGT